MSSQMCLQIIALNELLFAVCALVGLVNCMNTNVHFVLFLILK